MNMDRNIFCNSIQFINKLFTNYKKLQLSQTIDKYCTQFDIGMLCNSRNITYTKQICFYLIGI